MLACLVAVVLLCAPLGVRSAKSVTIVKKTDTPFMHTMPFPYARFQHKFRGSQTGNTFVLFEAEYFNEGPGYHVHMKDDELFHITRGRVQFIVNGTQFCASTGDYVYVPRTVPQGILVRNDTGHTLPVQIQILLLPSGLEGFLDEIASIYETDWTNKAAANATSKKYGIVELPAVAWEELGCFDSASAPLTWSLSLALCFVLFHSLFQ